jgi:hypothetical protein
MLDGIRSTIDHDAQAHPLDQAHSATATPTGALVYCVCGHDGCAQRLEVDAKVWEAELARRRARSAGVQVWHARGDRLVPVAPDVDGLVPSMKENRGIA